MFHKFLNSLKRPGNESLIEAIQQGYQAFLEAQSKYISPMPKGQFKNPKLTTGSLYSRGLNDPVHEFRARTGIELIHKEPTFSEQKRIWNNWNLMTDDMKRLSNIKSMEIYGKTNEENHKHILKQKLQLGWRNMRLKK